MKFNVKIDESLQDMGDRLRRLEKKNSNCIAHHVAYSINMEKGEKRR